MFSYAQQLTLHLSLVCPPSGLAAFALQCVFVTFARHVSDIFFALLFSTLANLVYPAVSSLVSRCGFFLDRSIDTT